jgi:hypothetical protein
MDKALQEGENDKIDHGADHADYGELGEPHELYFLVLYEHLKFGNHSWLFC